MNHPSKLIDELVKTQLKAALKELGFKNKSSTFFRQNGELVEVISPQKVSGTTLAMQNSQSTLASIGLKFMKFSEGQPQVHHRRITIARYVNAGN